MTDPRNHDAEIILFPDKVIGQTEGLMFGQFLELAGRCINNGLYDPASPNARGDGLRADVLEAIRALRPTHVRYPGGCATSYFDWQELVGPREQRPHAKLFGVTGVAQETAFGIPEAHELCKELGAELYLTINAHTQTPEEAAALVEYLNSDLPTKWADLRRQHGHPEPFNVKYLSLGNEIYGNWQNGQKTALEYAKWCREALRQMKRVDPSIKVAVCGLGRPDPEWDRTVLFHTIGLADMISVHNYYGTPIFRDSMAAGRVCQELFDLVNAVITEAVDSTLGLSSRAVREMCGLPENVTRPGIAFDEWNVWYRSTHDPEKDLEEWFNYMDALTVANLFHTILRNSQTVALSNISLAVNTMAGIMTEPDKMVKQSIWFAQKMLRDTFSDCRILQTIVADAPVFKAKHPRFFCGTVDPEKAKDETLPTLVHYDDIDALDVLAGIDREQGKLYLSVIQKLEDRSLKVQLNLRGLAVKTDTVRIRELSGESLQAMNTYESPDQVGIREEVISLDSEYTFKPASYTILEFNLE